MKESTIAEALNLPNVDQAVNALLEGASPTAVKAGTEVYIVDDETSGLDGTCGTVQGASRRGNGFVDVKLKNGKVYPVLSCFLFAK